MSGPRLLDTNFILRFLVQDEEHHAKIAARLFAACDRGELTLVVLPSVLAECVFVLESFYGHPRADIASALSSLISSPGIQLDDAAIHLDALNRYAGSKLHFVDCTLAAHAAATRTPIASFDKGLRKFSDITVKLDQL